MFSSLFKRPQPKPPATPEGVVVYAIGDIHGRADLLEPLVKAIWADRKPGREIVVVFLGDYIDRGPSSPEVLDMLLQLEETPGVTWHFLRGNHEQAMIDFLDDPVEAGPSWGAFGGRETLESYSVEAPYGSDARLWRVARDALEARIPDAHVAFLRRLPTRVELGDYFFVHAGARPGVALERQHDLDLMRIRDQFLNHDRSFEKVIVHGHSITTDVHADHRRIGVDTGAYASGVLTAIKLDGEERSLLQTEPDMGEGIRVIRRELGVPA